MRYLKNFNESKIELNNSDILTWLKSEFKKSSIEKVGDKFRIKCESSLEDEGEYYDKVNIVVKIKDDVVSIDGNMKRLGKVINKVINKKWSDKEEISAMKTVKNIDDAKKFIKSKICKYCC